MNPRSTHQRRAGYSFIELLVASASAAVLMGGMASTLYVASQALNLDQGAVADRTRTVSAVDIMMRDVRNALTFTERTATAITFTVPDRDGDSAHETLRYAWSGVAGDPLTLELNGATAVNVVEDVTALDLTYLERFVAAPVTDTGDPPPIVLYVVDDAASISTNESDRAALMTTWGYEVQYLSDDASQTEYNDALANAAAAYVSSTVVAGTVGDKLTDTAVGVLTEDKGLDNELGFASSSATESRTTINITDNTHSITTGLATGSLTLLNTSRNLQWLEGTLAPGRTTLAEINGNPALMLLDAGDTMHSGGTAAGRRGFLPWRNNVSVAQMEDDCKTIMQRSIEWAAGADGGSGDTGGVVYHEFTEAKLDSNGTNLSIDVPPGFAENDLLIAVLVTDADEAHATPSGWTQIDTGTGDGRVTLTVWWKLASSSEPSSYNFTWGSGERAYGWIMRFTGHDTANPIHTFATDSGSSSNAPPTPAVTTTVDNCMILRIGGFDDDDITEDDTGLAGHTSITMDESGTSMSCSGGAGYVDLPTAGDSGASNFDLTALEEYRTLTIAIAPEAP